MRYIISVVLFLLLCNLPHSLQAELIKRISVTWESDMSGDATVTVAIHGKILRVVTDPGAAAPTDNYDVTLIDVDGADLFVGQGIDRDTINTEQFIPGVKITDGTVSSVLPVIYDGNATLTIAAAGDTKGGTVIVYYSVLDF